MAPTPVSAARRRRAASSSNLPLAGLLLLALGAGCKDEPPKVPELQISSDLPAGTVDQVLRGAAGRGAPLGERVAGLSLGASVLPATPDAPGAAPAPAAAPPGGASPMPATPPPAPAAPAPGAGGDLRWDLEPYGAIAAAARGELERIPQSGVDVPDLWRDQGNTWVAVGGRAEVLMAGVRGLVATGHVGRSNQPEMPNRYTALTEPWLKGKVAIAAPTGGASLAHFAALFQAWGEERTRNWMKGLQENQVLVLETDADVRRAVVEERAVVGLLSSDEAAKAKASAAQVEIEYPNQKSIGTFVWPTALSRPRGTAHSAAAAKLFEKLADRTTEQLLVAREPGFMPLRAGIPVPPGVRGASNLVVVAVTPARIVEEINRRKAELSEWTNQMRAQMPKPDAPAAQAPSP